jgi:Transposase IS66 family
VTEVACWAHVRRYFYDIHISSNAPIAGEALQWIGQLFDVERTARIACQTATASSSKRGTPPYRRSCSVP